MAANDNSKQSPGTETVTTELESAKLTDPIGTVYKRSIWSYIDPCGHNPI